MRGQVDRQQSMFVAFNIEERVPEDHPLRPVKRWCDRVLAKMSRDFNRAYGETGNVSIPPECLITALLLRAMYSIPSETKLCEACEFNLLYRWFIDWPAERKMWTQEAFSVNRDRFELHDLPERCDGRGRGVEPVADDEAERSDMTMAEQIEAIRLNADRQTHHTCPGPASALPAESPPFRSHPPLA